MHDQVDYTASLVGTLNQVAGFVIGVAAVEYGTTKVV
jgi:fosmidomycin resistance protein